MLTDKTIDVHSLPIIDSHDWSYHLIDKCLGEASLLQSPANSLIQELQEVIPSQGTD